MGLGLHANFTNVSKVLFVTRMATVKQYSGGHTERLQHCYLKSSVEIALCTSTTSG